MEVKEQLVAPIKSNLKHVGARKTKKTTPNKNPLNERLRKAAQPPYSTYE